MKNRITIDPITRLEGHGKIEIFLDKKGAVENVYFHIKAYENCISCRGGLNETK